jgi:hypothetical protein
VRLAINIALLIALPAWADPSFMAGLGGRPVAAAPVSSNIVFDASSEGTGTSTLSWTHTPVGTPRGVILFCVNTGSATDVFTGATYGGVSMTQLNSASDSLGEAGFTEGYFLGASIPTGAQTAACSVLSGIQAKWGVAFSVTADTNTQTAGTISCIAESGAGAGIDDPSCTVSTITGASWAAAALYSGQTAAASTSAGSGFTLSQANEFGSFSSASEYATAQKSSGDWTAVFTTAGADDVAMVAIAIEETD